MIVMRHESQNLKQKFLVIYSPIGATSAPDHHSENDDDHQNRVEVHLSPGGEKDIFLSTRETQVGLLTETSSEFNS